MFFLNLYLCTRFVLGQSHTSVQRVLVPLPPPSPPPNPPSPISVPLLSTLPFCFYLQLGFILFFCFVLYEEWPCDNGFASVLGNMMGSPWGHDWQRLPKDKDWGAGGGLSQTKVEWEILMEGCYIVIQ